MKYICITGGACVGKTTLINSLRGLGHSVVEEAATVIIQEGKYHPVNDFKDFQMCVLGLQMRNEARSFLINDKPAVFFDRGTLDGAAYYIMHDKPVPKYLKSEGIYDLVLLLEPLDLWEDNGARYEDLEFTNKITPILEEVYTSAGHKVIRIPAGTKEERLKRVLELI